MLSPMDDYFIHQVDAALNEPPTTDPRFFESLYFAIHEPNGAATLIVRLQTYPNMGVMDAHVIGVLGQRQYNLRLSRVIRNDREVTRIGPLTLEITEPMKRWRLALEDASASCTFDLEFAARMPPFDGGTFDAGLALQERHFTQSGRCKGWFRIGDSVFRNDNFLAHRDRSWGVRGPLVGAAPAAARSFDFHLWVPVQFEDCCIFFTAQEDASGRLTKLDGALRWEGETDAIAIKDVKHDITFQAGSRRMQHATLTLTLENAEKIEMTASHLGDAFLSGAGAYAFPPRGTYRGDLVVEGEVWDFSDPVVAEAFRNMNSDQFAEYRWGDRHGYGIFEFFIAESQRYGIAPPEE